MSTRRPLQRIRVIGSRIPNSRRDYLAMEGSPEYGGGQQDLKPCHLIGVRFNLPNDYPQFGRTRAEYLVPAALLTHLPQSCCL